MHEDAPVLSATPRTRTGSRYAQRVRKAGGLPAIVYGHKQTPTPVTIEAHGALAHILKGEKVFALDLEGQREYVLLKDIGYDYLGTNVLHVDLARVRLDERVNTRTHVKLIGEPVGLKKAGAILMNPVTEIELNCLVTNLPDFIEVDISHLDVNGALHAGEIKLPKETMKLLTDADTIIAQVKVMVEQATTAEGATVEGAAGTQPEVIGEKERAAKAAAEAAPKKK
jgi:large subunit ribosomal protein L25